MTSNLRQEYQRKVNELKDYDFSVFNIHRIQEEMAGNITKGVEECIISLFDELSHKYHYFDEGSKNVHYYNGWKTNKAYIINKKVIIPFYNAYDNWDKRFRPTNYRCVEKLSDIEKALNYLDGVRIIATKDSSGISRGDVVIAERDGNAIIKQQKLSYWQGYRRKKWKKWRYQERHYLQEERHWKTSIMNTYGMIS